MESECENSEREFITLLIDLYRDSPELWKVKSKDYFNRNKKNAALGKIVEALKVLKPDFTVKLLKAKINNLRTSFNRMYKAIERKKVSGTSTDDIPESSLWYYNDMFFIKDQLEIAATETSEKALLMDDEEEDEYIRRIEELEKTEEVVIDKKMELEDLTTKVLRKHFLKFVSFAEMELEDLTTKIEEKRAQLQCEYILITCDIQYLHNALYITAAVQISNNQKQAVVGFSRMYVCISSDTLSIESQTEVSIPLSTVFDNYKRALSAWAKKGEFCNAVETDNVTIISSVPGFEKASSTGCIFSGRQSKSGTRRKNCNYHWISLRNQEEVVW